MSKCWYCNEELTSAGNPKHLGICNKCYAEMFKEGNDLIEKMTTKVADLEAKLAENEAYIQGNIPKLIEANKSMSKQLAEKEKEIEKITKVVAYRDDMNMSTTINGVKFTNEQIITLQNIDYFADKHNQDKISFAVEQLEKVKEKINDCPITDYDTNKHFVKMYQSDVIRQLDNQIKQLKEMK